MKKDYEKYFEKTLPIINKGARGKYAIVSGKEGEFVIWSDDNSAKSVVLFEISEVKEVKETINSVIVELDIDLEVSTIYLNKERGPEM